MTTELTQARPQHNHVLDENQWTAQRSAHVQLLSTVVNAHRQRAIKGEKHPIVDFLFEYYHFKPAKLLEWSPGLGVFLKGNQALEFLSANHYGKSDLGVYINPACFPEKRLVGLDWIINLLESTQQRKPVFGCFGLHEWCMVYEKSDIRHPYLPLRLTHSQTRKIVEQSQVQCTHYDAFRFYSKSARRFNRHKLNRADMASYEQPGCLHSNMDLYRWAYKFHPWLASELIAETFLLALNIRETDMRASPYDVSDYTALAAIKIETRQGKEEYARLQKGYYQKARVLRTKLIGRLKLLKSELVSLKIPV